MTYKRLIGKFWVRFMPKITVTESLCWEWISGRNLQGYGVISVNNKTRLASREVYSRVFGPIPDGGCALHSCDNPACVNPLHLFIGSNRDNSVDMARKGRAGGQKLTLTQAIAIYNEKGDWDTMAAKYGITRQAIYRIKMRKNWRHMHDRNEYCSGTSDSVKAVPNPLRAIS